MENELPKGWMNVPLKDFSKVEWGNTSITKKSYTENGFPAYSAAGQDGNLNKYEKEGEAIILSAIGARCGRCFYATGKWTAIKNTIVIQSNPNFINHKLLFYFLNDPQRWAISGAAQPFITMATSNEILYPLAPLSEQHRIVAKLDELMEKAERSKKRLEKIPLILKRFRQSVLAAAVSGKLTEEWREKNKIKSIADKNFETDENGWLIMRSDEACSVVASGSTPPNNPFTSEGDIPFLKVYNIVNQKINFDYKPQFVSREIHDTKLKRCKLFPNDVIINIVGPPLGKVALVTNQYPEWNMNQALVLFRAKEFLTHNFLFYILIEGSEIKRLENEYRGTAGQTNISLTQCRNFIFHIPSKKEQHEIVRRVEALFAFADKIETRYTKAKAQFDKLPQALLAKAFKGELVEQDEKDEGAGVLLERIRKETREKIVTRVKKKAVSNY
jgi:type I restriction enzyme S subunit